MTRPTDSLEYLTALAAQFPATLALIIERDGEEITYNYDGTFNTSAPESVDGYDGIRATYGTFYGWEGEQS